MKIELSKEARAEAIASIERYFEDNMGERIGNIAASGFLNFFLEEVGPIIYNRAIADAQAKIQARVQDMSGELYEDEFPYWRRIESQRKKK